MHIANLFYMSKWYNICKEVLSYWLAWVKNCQFHWNGLANFRRSCCTQKHVHDINMLKLISNLSGASRWDIMTKIFEMVRSPVGCQPCQFLPDSGNKSNLTNARWPKALLQNGGQELRKKALNETKRIPSKHIIAIKEKLWAFLIKSLLKLDESANFWWWGKGVLHPHTTNIHQIDLSNYANLRCVGMMSIYLMGVCYQKGVVRRCVWGATWCWQDSPVSSWIFQQESAAGPVVLILTCRRSPIICPLYHYS